MAQGASEGPDGRHRPRRSKPIAARRRRTSSSSRPTAAATSCSTGLDTLAEVCDAGTRVVVIGHINDVVLYRELMRRGVSDYLIAPVGTLDVVRAISRPVLARRTPSRSAASIAVVGAKGGVGASTVAHNIAWAIARDVQLDAVVADLDLAVRHRRPRLQPGPAAGHRRRGVLAGPHRHRLRRPPAVEVHRPPEPAGGAGDARPGLRLRRRGVRRRSSTCCAPPCRASCSTCRIMWTGWTQRTLISADDILIVAAPDLANLRNAKNLIDLLQRRAAERPPPALLPQPGRRAEAAGDQAGRLRQGARDRADRGHPVRAAAVRHRRQQRPDDRRGVVQPSHRGDVPLARAVADRPHRGEAVAHEPAHAAASRSSGASSRKALRSMFGKRSTSGPDVRSPAPAAAAGCAAAGRRARVRARRRRRRRRPRAAPVRRPRRADHVAAAGARTRPEADRADRARQPAFGELLRDQEHDLRGADRGDRPVAARAARRRVRARGNPRHRQRDHRDQERRDVDRRAGRTARRHLQRRARLRPARAAAGARRHRRHHGERRRARSTSKSTARSSRPASASATTSSC